MTDKKEEPKPETKEQTPAPALAAKEEPKEKKDNRGGKSEVTYTCTRLKHDGSVCGATVNAKGRALHDKLNHKEDYEKEHPSKLKEYVQKLDSKANEIKEQVTGEKKEEPKPQPVGSSGISGKVEDKETNFILKIVIAFIGVILVIFFIWRFAASKFQGERQEQAQIAVQTPPPAPAPVQPTEYRHPDRYDPLMKCFRE